MKKSRFTEEQIVFALKQAELGTPVPEVCRKLGISDATFYTWRKKYGGISPSELKHMRQLEEENLRLKKLVADLSLDKAMLQDVLAKRTDAGTPARMGPGPAGTLRGQRKAGLLCVTGQPQLFPLPFCGGRRQRATPANQGDHRNPGPLWLPQSSRHAQAGGLAG
jgi:putative transposase